MFVSDRWWVLLVLLHTYHMAGNGSTVSMGGGVEWCV